MFDSEEAHEGEVLEGTEWPAQTQVIKFSQTEAEIRAEIAKCQDIDFSKPDDYDRGRMAIANCVSTRTAIEERRVELKAPSLEFGRKVDARAKLLTSLITPTEKKLVADRKVVDDEKERVRAEKKAAEEARQQAERDALRAAEQAELDRQRAEIEAERKKLAAEKEAAEARAKAEREEREAAERQAKEAREAEERRLREAKEAEERAERARKAEAERIENKRIADAQEAERQRLAAERRKLEDEQKAERDRAAAERQKLEDERRAVDQEKERLAREGIARDVRERTERETRERIAREQKEAEERKAAQAKHEAEEKARIEALKPDLEKVLAFAKMIRDLAAHEPPIHSNMAIEAMIQASEGLRAIADELEAFATVPG